MSDFMRSIPITPDMVGLWVPSGQNRAANLVKPELGGQCYGPHPNVPVISTFQPPNILLDGGLNVWSDATHLSSWIEEPSEASTVNREATEKIEGNYSCRLDIDASNSNAQIRQSGRSLIPLKRYKLVIWYMNSLVGKTAIADLRSAGAEVFLQEDGTWKDSYASINLPNSLIWTSYELPFYGHADYSTYQLLLKRGSAASSSIYFDNMSIKELKPSLINPSVGWHFITDDYIHCGNDSSLDLRTKITVGAWVYINSLTDAGIVGRRYYGQYTYGLRIETNRLRMMIYDTDGAKRTAMLSTALVLKKWHCVIGTFDVDGGSDNLNIYTNTILGIPTTASLGPHTGTNNYIGAVGWDLKFFDGYIALPFIAKATWTQQQGDNFYNATKGLFSPRGVL